MQTRIAFCGSQRSGKTTAANYLRDHYGAVVLSLASPIKEIAWNLFDAREKDRPLLIGIGEALRTVDPLVFCKALIRQVEQYPTEDLIVVDDVRSPLEWAFLAQHGFHHIFVQTDIEKRVQRPGFDAGCLLDPTEQNVDLIPECPILYNNGSLEDFHGAVACHLFGLKVLGVDLTEKV